MNGVFSFGIDEDGKFFFESATDRYDTEVEPTEIEAEALKHIINVTGAVHLYDRSGDYLTICNDSDVDFCRLKATPRSLWFSLDVPDEFKNDERLASVPNKNQRHWKIKLKSIDEIGNYADIIEAASKLVY